MGWPSKDPAVYRSVGRWSGLASPVWPRWLRRTLAVVLVLEWLTTAFVLFVVVSFSCFFGASTTQDSATNHPLAVAALVWLPITLLVLAGQRRLPQRSAHVALAVVALLHLALVGVLFDAVPYPEPPVCEDALP